jgi:hypothetical protein
VLLFSGGRKPTPATPRSVRIVSTQDSNAAASATGGTGACGAGGCWGAGIDRRVSSPVAPSPFFTFLLPPYTVPLLRKYEKRLRSENSCRPLFLLPRHRMPTCVPLSRHRQSSDPPTKPDLHLELQRASSYKTRILFYIFLILVLAYVPLQKFLYLFTFWSSESSRTRTGRCRSSCVFAEPK